jgi:hypothetical protein
MVVAVMMVMIVMVVVVMMVVPWLQKVGSNGATLPPKSKAGFPLQPYRNVS